MPRRRPGPRAAPPRGAAAVFVAIALVAITAILALALNVGHLYAVRGELHNAVDAGALAGAQELDGTPDRLAGAEAFGRDFAARHFTDARVGVEAEAVQLGRWARPDQACSTFGGVAAGVPQPGGWQFCRIDARDARAARDINAVRVVAARAEGSPGGGGAPVFMGGALGSGPTADVRAEAVAVTGGPCESRCPTAPFVIRSGCLASTEALRCGQQYTLGLSNATVDTAGWTNLTESRSVNSNAICTVLQGGLAGCELSTGDVIGTSNGNQWSASNCKDPNDAGVKTLCDWFYRFLGQEMQIPIVEYPGDADPSACEGGYEGMGVVVGFATFRVANVYCKTEDSKAGACAFATSQCVAIEFVCGARDDEVASVGCGWWGTSPLRPVLAR